MKITNLLNSASMDLHATAASKSEAISKLVELMNAGGRLNDKAAYKEAVLKREAGGSTGVGEGIAIPHAKSAAVKEAGVAFMRCDAGVDFDSLDNEPAKLFFMIAAPEGKNDLHLEVLSHLGTLLMNPEVTQALLAAQSKEEICSILDKEEAAKFTAEVTAADTAAAAGSYRILAVTACPTGIAHTFMAAESLEQKAKKRGISIKVEKNGQAGVKDALTAAEIAACDGIIVAADKDVAMNRFDGKPVVITKVADGINKADELIDKILQGEAPIYKATGAKDEGAASVENESIGRKIYKDLMNGVSHMLPFVIGGGILIALAFLLDVGNAGTAKFGSGTPTAAFFKNVGGVAFGMMMPILAGFIAMSIGDRPALMPGVVAGLLANAGGSGFFGALIGGFVAGYLIVALKKATNGMPPSLEGIKPILIFPVLGLLIIGFLMTFVINPPTAAFNGWLNETLKSMGTGSKIILGLILGGMMSVDFGGPINKAAYVFGTASLAGANGAAVSSPIMASVMAGGMVPPLAIAISMLIFKKKYTSRERQACLPNIIMGCSFITEGAIPFAAADPIRVIPSCAIGSAIAGALSMAFDCSLPAPHGGAFVFGVVANWPMYAAAILAGAVLAAVILGFIKKDAVEE